MCLFGGVAGAFPKLVPRAQPPARFYRIIPGQIWWTLIHWPWRQFRAAVAAGGQGIFPPRLGPPQGGVYITDRASLRGCLSPADFAQRLSLPAPTQLECQLYGCAVIQFRRP